MSAIRWRRPAPSPLARRREDRAGRITLVRGLLLFESSLYSAVTPVLPHYAPPCTRPSRRRPARRRLSGGPDPRRADRRLDRVAGRRAAHDAGRLDRVRRRDRRVRVRPRPRRARRCCASSRAPLRPDLGRRPDVGDRRCAARAPGRDDRHGDRRRDVRHPARAAARHLRRPVGTAPVFCALGALSLGLAVWVAWPSRAVHARPADRPDRVTRGILPPPGAGLGTWLIMLEAMMIGATTSCFRCACRIRRRGRGDRRHLPARGRPEHRSVAVVGRITDRRGAGCRCRRPADRRRADRRAVRWRAAAGARSA